MPAIALATPVPKSRTQAQIREELLPHRRRPFSDLAHSDADDLQRFCLVIDRPSVLEHLLAAQGYDPHRLAGRMLDDVAGPEHLSAQHQRLREIAVNPRAEGRHGEPDLAVRV